MVIYQLRAVVPVYHVWCKTARMVPLSCVQRTESCSAIETVNQNCSKDMTRENNKKLR